MKTLCALVAGTIFLLTSLYCVLAFIPYTYFFVVHAPPFAWLVWFVRLHPFLYWVGFASGAAAMWRSNMPRWLLAAAGTFFALVGVYASWSHLLRNISNDGSAYLWAMVFLLPLLLVGISQLRAGASSPSELRLITFRSGILIGCMASTLSIAGAQLRTYNQAGMTFVGAIDVVVMIIAVLAHVWVAVAIVALLNLLQMLCARTPLKSHARILSVGTGLFILLTVTFGNFLRNSLSLRGWAGWLYASACALAVTVWSLAVLGSALLADESSQTHHARRAVILLLALLFGLAAPSLIGEVDWNGVLGSASTLLVWILLSATLYVSMAKTGRYRAAVALILLIAAIAHYGAQGVALSRAASIGTTDVALRRDMDIYADRNPSFAMMRSALGEERSEPCDESCKLLRQYTNVKNIELKSELEIAGPLSPAAVPRPNVFILVLDSLRADYVGAYNPQADFTPNLDAFAKQNLQLKNAYADYAGTTLSEPVIWTGALLPHSHYPRPFQKLNSLERMARVDGYQLIMSWDTVLAQIFAGSSDILKLDTGMERWGQLELSSTLKQLYAALDARKDSRPIFFYSQPMNVQMHAENDLPALTADNWRQRSGFSNKVAFKVHQADEILGSFFADLKKRGLYDNSIIIVTADHGDATGEFGRQAHSTIIYPEVMKVPLIIHLPESIRGKYVFDADRLAALSDIAPTIYYLLGHRPVRHDLLFGRPLVAESLQELQSYYRDELFLASDVRGVYGLLAENGRYLYTHYDSPPKRMLFDLKTDPNAERDIANELNSKQYDQRILEYLRAIAQLYSFTPNGG